ncbi:protein translocase subunit SecD [Candidatus Parcubacteria bacterium]|nr:protein translocase subunit SecD [Candidatus Parcubacteria bacterium]
MAFWRRNKIRLAVAGIFLLGLVAGFFVAPPVWDTGINFWNRNVGIPKIKGFLKVPFRLGLDLIGGVHLAYDADTSKIPAGDRAGALESLRNVVERRVNLFGAQEPVVQLERAPGVQRLIVELAGIKDVDRAIQIIGETPVLEFREERQIDDRNKRLEELIGSQNFGQLKDFACTTPQLLHDLTAQANGDDPCFLPTQLTGQYLSRAQLDFEQNTGQPQVGLEFNSQGATLFAELTKRNEQKRLAIYLDGYLLSAPVVQGEITGGRAVINGNFTVDGARELARRLNAGALPVPIKLLSQQSVEASLGAGYLRQSLRAGVIGFAAVALFMLLWYRLPGLIAVMALFAYALLTLAIFKLVPVTLTLAGIAGFILSIGMAVDANVLIFERMKEELRGGKTLVAAINDGFRRAWTSIRDSNISTLITAVILFWLGESSVKGFALTLGLGVIVSMFSAITISRTLLKGFESTKVARVRWLFGVR